MYTNKKSLIIPLILFLIFLLILSESAFAAQIRLAWNPNQENDLGGYIVYYGLAPRTYGVTFEPIDVKKVRLIR